MHPVTAKTSRGASGSATRDRVHAIDWNLCLTSNHKLASGGGWYSRNTESVNIEGTDKPWLFTSGARGLNRFQLPLLGEDDAAGKYIVKLYFANVDDAKPGLFDIRLQGQTVASGVDISAASGRPLIKEFPGIAVDKNLVVELVSQDPAALATVAGIEVLRE